MTLAQPITTDRQFAEDVVRQLRSAGYVAYWAGGCVRDLLLGKTPKDYDVATDARPDSVRQLFGFKRTRAVGAAFGVILVHGPGGLTDIEVATFRSEGPYLDGRRPQHVVFCTPEQDALRRDFTINGMFYDPVEQQVLDFVGGQGDLQRRIVRAIGLPHDRFQEDKLRMLRAIRFAATMDFELEAETEAAISRMAADVRIVSAERITQEWKRMLNHASRCQALEFGRKTGLLDFIFPESSGLLEIGESGRWDRALQAVRLLGFNPSFEHSGSVGFELVLATWLCEAPGYSPKSAETMCRRLKFSNEELDRIVWLQSQCRVLDGIRFAQLSRIKRVLAHPYIFDLLAQIRAINTANGRDLHDVEFCEDYLRTTPGEVLDPPLILTGDDLIQLGLKPGREFKLLLDRVRDAQLNCQITTIGEAREMVQEMQGKNLGG